MNSLESLFYPDSIAVVGASKSTDKAGGILMENLKSFGGSVYPVNPSTERINDHEVYSDLSTVPASVDVVVVAIPSRKIPGLVAPAGKIGASWMVVLAGGFAEKGPEGEHRQSVLVRRAEEEGVRIVGPNCIGYFNATNSLNLSLMLSNPPTVKKGSALITQSGAYGMSVYDKSRDYRMNFSKMISLGNKADLRDEEVIDFFREDPTVSSTGCWMESVMDGRSFADSIGSMTGKKPVALMKVGRSQASTEAASSHTGRMSGDYSVFHDVLDDEGAYLLDNGDDLLHLLRGLDKQPTPSGDRVGIITNSGGTGVELADLLSEEGFKVPTLSDSLREKIDEIIPEIGSSRNPVDITTQWRRFPELYTTISELLLGSEEIDLLVPILLQRSALMEEVRDGLIQTVQESTSDVPVYVCWVTGFEGLEELKQLEQGGIPCYYGLKTTANVLKNLKPVPASPDGHAGDFDVESQKVPEDVSDVETLLKRIQDEGRSTLLETEVKSLLPYYGIDTPRRTTCDGPKQIYVESEEFAFPFVVKVMESGVVHKAKQGGVQIVHSREELEQAVEAFRSSFSEEARYLLEQWVPGAEFLVNLRYDSSFGSVLTLGIGGNYTEILSEFQVLRAPAEARSIARKITQLDGFQTIKEVNNLEDRVIGDFSQRVSIFSHLQKHYPEIGEIEVNPIRVSAEGIRAVDGAGSLRRG